MAALADVAGAAALCAVTITACGDGILAGGVYKPVEEIPPNAGLIDQVTAVLVVPTTVAVNC